MAYCSFRVLIKVVHNMVLVIMHLICFSNSGVPHLEST